MCLVVTFIHTVRRIAVYVIYCLFSDAVSTTNCIASNGRAIVKGHFLPFGGFLQHLTGSEGKPRTRCGYKAARPRLVWFAEVACKK
jgi:hypothetical protein